MFQAYGLQTHIRANRLRTLFLLASFVGLLHALLFSFSLLYEAAAGGTVGQMLARAVYDLLHRWPLAMGAALLWFAIAYFFQSRMIDFATGATPVSRTAAPKLYNALENLCISRGIPVPALKIIESDALNAYASGMSERDYAVTVTRGLLDTLTGQEIEAVLGHELTHIRNKDVQLMVVAVIFAGIFAFAGDMTFRNWNFPFGYTPSRGSSSRDRDKGSSGAAIIVVVIALGIIAISWGLSVLIRFAISRKREFLADAGSVELTRNPDAMISALRKIEAHAVIPGIQSRVSAFFIESPLQDEGTGWLSTHPSMSDRIAALTRYAGGIDTGALDAAPGGSTGRFLPEPGSATGIAPAAPVFGKRRKTPWG